MTEERIQQLETTVAEHDRQLQGVYAALNEVSQTMKAFANGIVELRESVQELRESQQAVIETQGYLIDSVSRLSDTVSVLSREAAEDRAAIREMQAEVRQIWEYLLNQRPNGNSG
ncbi:MAG: hypothetical protein KME17_03325 [Cyanosarcina radialis HA8281-LM2]|jgi:uncharacterized coiled-coil protein SlyX|nr:hypothetical protein [Cyanosarcina radialis HA8281-LM2]